MGIALIYGSWCSGVWSQTARLKPRTTRRQLQDAVMSTVPRITFSIVSDIECTYMSVSPFTTKSCHSLKMLPLKGVGDQIDVHVTCSSTPRITFVAHLLHERSQHMVSSASVALVLTLLLPKSKKWWTGHRVRVPFKQVPRLSCRYVKLYNHKIGAADIRALGLVGYHHTTTAHELQLTTLQGV